MPAVGILRLISDDSFVLPISGQYFCFCTIPRSIFARLQSLISNLKSAQRVVALTGAGVSAESGVPTFRDAQTGLWAKYDPTQLATAGAFARDPKLVWEWYEWRRAQRRDTQPNAGHFALAAMAKLFPAFVIVTQNIDGLHQRAGSPDVIELHGNLQRNRCSHENVIIDRAQARTRNDGLLACPRCGAYLRPDVVWFGETLPRDALERAFAETTRCDALFTIGTSGIVEPAASLPRYAKRAGACVVEINPEETPLSAIADVVVRGKSGEVLPEIVERLEKGD
ncbi:MAG: NAD-dependent deacylase [Chloroflexi bacterium]|nr:NAD-dependent deacylase [Chloroflexota bacterium]